MVASLMIWATEYKPDLQHPNRLCDVIGTFKATDSSKLYHKAAVVLRELVIWYGLEESAASNLLTTSTVH